MLGQDLLGRAQGEAHWCRYEVWGGLLRWAQLQDPGGSSSRQGRVREMGCVDLVRELPPCGSPQLAGPLDRIGPSTFQGSSHSRDAAGISLLAIALQITSWATKREKSRTQF